MIALYLILGILLLLFFLTLLPVRLEVSFRQEFALTLRYLFLSFRLLPGKEQPQKEEKPEKEEKKGGGLEKIKAILKQEGFFGFLKALFELVKMTASASRNVISRIKVRSFDLYLCLGGAGDAAEAAIRYGELSGAVYSACGFLFGLTGCRKKAVTVDLDYKSEENTVDFSAKISIRPIFVLKEGLSLLIKAMPSLRRLLGAGRKNKERVSQTRKQGAEQ